MFFIGQNLNYVHMTYSFLELLINWSRYLLFGVYFSPHHINTLSLNTNSRGNQSWNESKHFHLFNISKLMTMKSFKCHSLYYLQKMQKYLRRIHNLFITITNKLSLQLKALSNCDHFTVITVSHNDVLKWGFKNNKYQVTMP